jgi:hypothetical protein
MDLVPPKVRFQMLPKVSKAQLQLCIIFNVLQRVTVCLFVYEWFNIYNMLLYIMFKLNTIYNIMDSTTATTA